MGIPTGITSVGKQNLPSWIGSSAMILEVDTDYKEQTTIRGTLCLRRRIRALILRRISHWMNEFNQFPQGHCHAFISLQDPTLHSYTRWKSDACLSYSNSLRTHDWQTGLIWHSLQLFNIFCTVRMCFSSQRTLCFRIQGVPKKCPQLECILTSKKLYVLAYMVSHKKVPPNIEMKLSFEFQCIINARVNCKVISWDQRILIQLER